MRLRSLLKERLKLGSASKGWFSGMLGKLTPAVSLAALALALAAIVVVVLQGQGGQEPWPVVSALSSLAVAIVAVLALGQWRSQMRARSQQSAATDVLERAYENQELFREINRHAFAFLTNKTYKR